MLRPRLPALACLALAAATLLRLPAALESGNALNHVSGAWMALADDLARGTFYRPAWDPALGYGGTRFFPLAFVLHAALARSGLPLLATGPLLSAAAGLALVAGAAAFLRRAGHAWPAAAALAPLALAGFAGQLGLTSARGDLLAAALATWALASLLPPRPGAAPGLARAAALLVLAFLGKPTALAAAGAGVALLSLAGDPRRARRLALAVGLGAVAATLATELLSGGRFLALLGSLWSGGAAAADLARAPLRVADRLGREDPAGLALLAAAGLGLLLRRGDRGPALRLAALWLAASLASAVAVLASPGTGANHLLDLEVASALALGTSLAGPAPRLLRAAATLAALAGLATSVGLFSIDRRESRRSALRAALEAAGAPGTGPMLSEDPLIPLAAGERPYLLDAFMLRLGAERDPALAGPLLASLREGEFRAVVLLTALDGPGADDWFSRQLGPAAADELRRGWRLVATAGPYHVYRFGPAPVCAAGP